MTAQEKLKQLQAVEDEMSCGICGCEEMEIHLRKDYRAFVSCAECGLLGDTDVMELIE